MYAFAQMPYPELTLTFIGSIAAAVGIWSMPLLEAILGKRGGDRPSNTKQSALIALVVTLALGGVSWAMYSNLVAKQNQHFVALGHKACRSWSFASALPDQSFAATVMGRYEGVAGFTCADVSEHFFDLASGRRVKEPPGFYGRLTSTTD